MSDDPIGPPRTKQPPPSADEVEALFDGLVSSPPDPDAWRHVRQGLTMVALGMMILPCAGGCTLVFALSQMGGAANAPFHQHGELILLGLLYGGVGLGCLLMLAGVVRCRNVPDGEPGERTSRWCMVLCFFGATPLLVKAVLHYALNFNPAFDQLLQEMPWPAPLQEVLSLLLSLIGVVVFVLWSVFLIQVSRVFEDFSVEAGSVGCLVLAFVVGCSSFLIPDVPDSLKWQTVGFGGFVLLLLMVCVPLQLAHAMRPKRKWKRRPAPTEASEP